MPMSNAQRKYCLERLQQIERDKTESITAECARSQLPSVDEKCEMIRQGIAVLRPNSALSSRYNVGINDLFSFPPEEVIVLANSDLEKEEKGRLAKLRQAARKLRDQIMFGSPDDALKMISTFERRSF